MINKDIIINAYYMISLFEKAYSNDLFREENKAMITPLKLQQLMYFVEAYYMNKYHTDTLYDSQWYAWNFGVINKELYDYFKKFGPIQIILNDDELKQIDLLPSCNKKCIDKVYEVLSKYNCYDLVTLTFSGKSPSYELLKLKSNDMYIPDNLNNDFKIDKERTKEWFSKMFRI